MAGQASMVQKPLLTVVVIGESRRLVLAGAVAGRGEVPAAGRDEAPTAGQDVPATAEQAEVPAHASFWTADPSP